MMIDFERAKVGDGQREALPPVVPNKRAWTGEGRDGK